MLLPTEVNMVSNSRGELTPEQAIARKLAAQELARHWQEFSRWRQAERCNEAADKSLQTRGMLAPPRTSKPDPSVPGSRP